MPDIEDPTDPTTAEVLSPISLPITSVMVKPPLRKRRGVVSRDIVISPPAAPRAVTKLRSKTTSEGIPLRRSSRLRTLIPDTTCHIKRLPVELVLMVFITVGKMEHGVKERVCPYVRTVLKLAHVCRYWKEIVTDIPPVSWRSIFTYFIDPYDPRKVEQFGEYPMDPKHLVEFIRKYQIKRLGSLAIDSVPCKTFNFSLAQRNRGPQEVPLRHLYFSGLNHLSAEFLLTNRFPNLVSLTFGYSQISHITQIAGILRHPLICDELKLDHAIYRREGAAVQNPYTVCVLYALATLQEWIHFQSLVIETSNPAASPIPLEEDSTWICDSSQRDHVREFQSTRIRPPSLKFLEIRGFSAMKLRGMKIGLQDLRYLKLNIEKFEHGKDATQGWISRKWWEDFWCFLFQAGEKLQIIEITGIRHRKDWLDFAKARKLLSKTCIICLDAETPEDVVDVLEAADPTALIARNLVVIMWYKERKVHVIGTKPE